VDIAASQLYREGRYHLQADGAVLSSDAMIDRLEELCERFPLVSVEDPLFEDDWEGWKQLTSRLGGRVQLSGDDLFVTSATRLQKGIDCGAANGVVIKPNQIGTLTEAVQTVALAKSAGYATVISPRSGELWDPYLVHLCVGQNLGQGKLVGAYSSGESNLNEIIRIGDRLGSTAVYRDGNILRHFSCGQIAASDRQGPAK
jgi:enolase